jgi:hypothetical protein
MELCADRHETRVSARGRAEEMADRSSGKLHLRSRGGTSGGAPGE